MVCSVVCFMRVGTAMPRSGSTAGRASARKQPRTPATGRRSAAAPSTAAARRAAAANAPAAVAAARRQTTTAATRGRAAGSRSARMGRAAATEPGPVQPTDSVHSVSEPSLQEMVGRMVRDAVTSALQDRPPPEQAATMTPARAVATQDPAPVAMAAVVSETPPPLAVALAQPTSSQGVPPIGADLAAQAPGNSTARAAVPPSVAAQIVGHQYVDLGSLIDETRTLPSRPADAGFLHGPDGRGQSAAPRRQIPHFGAWATAFLRYAAVYSTAHPADVAGLLEHMHQVASLQTPGLGFAWREFDEGFRRARAIHPAAHPWGSTAANSTLWLSAVARGIAGTQSGAHRSVSSAGTVRINRTASPPGAFRAACPGYNRPAGCRRYPCPLRHECRICRGPHSMVICNRRPLPALPGARRAGRR